MAQSPLNYAITKMIAAQLFGVVAFAVAFGGFLVSAPLGHAWQQDQQKAMPGMDMSHDDMSSMGPSMAAMAGHMYITPLRPKEPGDEDKAKAVVAAVKAAIERY